MTPDPATTPTVDVLPDALALAALGWRVVPIRPGYKHPKGLQQWQKAATSDPDTITSWFTGLYRGHNVGVHTGELPDGRFLFVVDVDVSHDKRGAESLAMLEHDHGTLPDTVESITGQPTPAEQQWVNAAEQAYHLANAQPPTPIADDVDKYI